MLTRSLLCFGAASIFVVGCSSRPRVAPPIDLQAGTGRVAAEATEGGDLLVWARKDNVETTFRLVADGPYRVVREEQGILIATSKGEMKWQSTEKEIDLAGCSMGDGAAPVPSKGTVTIASIARKNGEARQVIVDSSTSEGAEVQELNHSAGIVGSVGPYLFIQEMSYMYACGAHGGTTASFFVWDVEQGKVVDVLPEFQPTQDMLDKAKKILDEVGDGLGDSDESDVEPGAVLLSPIYGERGGLRFDVQFTRWACYACGDGQWSSYTRSAVVPTQWIPKRMRDWAIPPVAVKEFAEKNPDWQVRGWSKR